MTLEIRALVEPSVAPNSLAVLIFVMDVTIATAVYCLGLRHLSLSMLTSILSGSWEVSAKLPKQRAGS